MTCPGCGRQIPPDEVRCPACGSVPDGELTATRAGVPSPSRPPDDEGEEQGTIAAEALPEALRSGAKAAYDALKPGEKIGPRYEIVSVLGMGGMGVVYRARDLSLDREVALKVIRPEMAKVPGIMERFRREILLASKVTHKNILRIHDLGEAAGLSYISMNFVEGETLRDVMEREGAMTVESALPIVLQLVQALAAAHDAGVVHRDLKPQNVLLGADRTAYVADFGLSRSLETGETMTQTGMILGTIDYMSPEQARGETPDHRGDIYSFGIILYEMLSGRLPFRADTALGSMMKRVHEDVPRLKEKIPSWLSAIVARCLKRDPEDRYQSASEILRDLEARKARMAWRRWRKPRFLLRAAGLVLALGLAVAGGIAGVRWLVGRRASAEVAPRASLALLPFQNATGDPRYDWSVTGLPDLVRTDLQQTRALRLVGEDRVDGILGALKIGAGGDLRPDAVVRIAALLGVDGVLTGRLLKAGDQFRIDASLQRGGGAPPASIRVEGMGEESLFRMVDDLTRRVRGELGVSARWGEADRGVTELATESVEALRLYGEGLALVRGGNLLGAADRLAAAAQADPGFVAAQALLAETYDRLGYSEKAAATAEEGARHLQDASPFEAARMRAVRARLANDRDGAVAAYRSLVELAPSDADAHFNLASALEDAGDLEGALASFRKVVELDPKHPDGHYAVGRVMVKRGDAAGALGELNAALALHVEVGNEEGRAAAINGLGNAHSGLGRDDEAMDYFRQALEIRERIGDRRGVAVTLNNMADVLAHQGRYDEAVAIEQQALAINAEIGNRAGSVRAYANLGEIYLQAGRPEDALTAYRESLKIVRELGDEVDLAWNLANVGYVNAVLGDYLEAYFFLKEALAKRREIGSKAEIVRSLVDLGDIEQIQGRYDEALKYLVEGLDLGRETGNKYATAVLTAKLALLQEDQGEFGSAMKSLADADALAAEIGDKDLAVGIRAYQGGLRRRAGDLDGARGTLDEALGMARDLGSLERIAEVQAHRGLLLAQQGRGGEAREALREAIEAAQGSGYHRLRLLARLRSAEVAGNIAELEAAGEEADSSGLAPLVPVAQIAIARLRLAGGDPAAAGRAADRAIEAATPLGQRDLLVEAYHLAGLAQAARGNPREAAIRYERALAPLEEIVANLDPAQRATFLVRPPIAAFHADASAAFAGQALSGPAGRLAAVFGPRA